jgi:hypothetical protein
VLHVLWHSACVCVEAPVVSTVHWPVAPQLYIAGLHDAVQTAFVCLPVAGTWVHVCVAGSVHA